MKKQCALLLLLALLLSFCGCAAAPGSPELSGYPDGEFEHLYLLYNDVMYTYDTSGSGRWEDGAQQVEALGLSQVAAVELVDNQNAPTKNLQATRMRVGTPIYARDGEDAVYVLLDEGILWRMKPCDAASDPRNQ